MRNKTDTILFGHPRNFALFADATDFRHIGLDNIQSAALEPRDERLPAGQHFAARDGHRRILPQQRDRKSTRLNSSHGYISYAVFCLKKKKNKYPSHTQHIYKYLCSLVLHSLPPCSPMLLELVRDHRRLQRMRFEAPLSLLAVACIFI